VFGLVKFLMAATVKIAAIFVSVSAAPLLMWFMANRT
jgi:hypothetical protein